MIKRAEGDGGAENIVLLGWLLVALKWTRSEGAGLGSRATAYRTTDCREIAPESWLDHPRYPLPPHLAVSQPGGWQGVTRETRKGLNVPRWKLVSEQPQRLDKSTRFRPKGESKGDGPTNELGGYVGSTWPLLPHTRTRGLFFQTEGETKD